MTTATRYRIIATHETPSGLRSLLDRQHALGIHANDWYDSAEDANVVADMLSKRIDGLGTSTIYSVIHD